MLGRVNGVSQDLHGGHEMPLRTRAHSWDLVSGKRHQESKQGHLHIAGAGEMALTHVLSPAGQGGRTIVIPLMKILRF